MVNSTIRPMRYMMNTIWLVFLCGSPIVDITAPFTAQANSMNLINIAIFVYKFKGGSRYIQDFLGIFINIVLFMPVIFWASRHCACP